MPKIFEYFGMVFFFYANEHLPIHVYVSYGEFEIKIELDYENGKLKKLNVGKVKGRKSLPEKQLNDALKFVEVYHESIIEKWTNFFVKNMKVKCETIKQKL